MLDNQLYFEVLVTIEERQLSLKISTLDILYRNNETFNNNLLKSEQVQNEIADLQKFGIQQIPSERFNDVSSSALDYTILSHETQELLSHYMIVATFSFYEKTLKKLLYYSNKLNEKELKSCFKNEQLIKILNEKFAVDYTKMIDFPQIEELRCLNNTIKHQGIVSSELETSNNKWILDTEIKQTYEDYIRLKDSPLNMIKELRPLITLQVNFDTDT